MFLDEKVGFQYFLNRLKRTQVPFVGVYWSGAAHYPYKDYSQSAAINQQIFYPYPRYQNSLRLLDNEIKALYSQLKKQQLLDNTILVVVGDHGEIFGQHDNAWVHGQSLYQEEIKVPLLIYAPALFKSQQVHAVTSSADILPTILAAIHQTPSSYFQGESLLTSLKRDYIFIYNDNDEIAAISQQQIKMRISFANNTCFSYDLIHDPQETRPLPCTDLKQKQAILAFRHYQPALLQRLNRS
jgi:arylsulfatase A-like enzyme